MSASYVPTRIVARTLYSPTLGWLELQGTDIGAQVAPGQFAMVVRPGDAADLRPRPFAYFSVRDAHTIRLLVRERPGATASLLTAPLGTVVPLLGPLGTAFGPPPACLWAVAGGVGAAAFGALVPHSRRPGALRVLVGIRNASDAGIIQALTEQMTPVGAEIAVSCEDGSVGRAGGVIDGLVAALADPSQAKPDAIYACGPDAMLRAVARLAADHHIACRVSVGVAMDCGVGTCGSCQHQDVAGNTLRACVDGPVYPAARLYR